MKDRYANLSRGRKQLADIILEQYDRVSFMSARELGNEAGVSESTAVRFAIDLGYEGYPEFQKQLQKLVRRQVRGTARMEEVYGELDQPQILKQTIMGDIERLRKTLTQIEGAAFEQSLEILDEARHIYVVGLRQSAPAAEYLYDYLRLVYGNSVVLVRSAIEHEILEQMLDIEQGDAVIGIGFPRYSLRTVRALEFASSRQAHIITITDGIYSPLNLYSSCVLTAASDMSSVVESLAAPFSVIGALITALSLRHADAVKKRLELLERTTRDYSGAYGDDMDMFEDRIEIYRESDNEI